MDKSKGRNIVLLACAVILLVVVASVTIKYKSTKETPTVDLIEIPEDTDSSDEIEGVEENTVELNVVEPDVIDSKDFVYDPFAEDSGWGDESIFGSKIIISGTGQRDTTSSGNIVVEGSDQETIAKKNTRRLSAAEARASIMEEVKSGDYAYRINEHDFSNGFGVYMNPKYDLVVSRIMGDTGYIGGPNGTEVGITELDNSLSLDEHRKQLLKESGYSKVYNYSNGAILEYGTPATIGLGIDDFENTKYYVAWRYNDESMNDYGGQLFCDTEMESTFGSGYYIELYNATSDLYYGYYLVEHNGRIFKAKGMSMYQGTLKDITLATIDTCVYPY